MIGRVLAAAYVLTIATLATVGFVIDSPAPILVAGLLTLPTSVPAGIGFYIVVGLLALLPGANPDSSSGSACSPPTACDGGTVGDAATWFLVAIEVLGVAALVTAALVNLLVLRAVASRRARSRSAA